MSLSKVVIWDVGDTFMRTSTLGLAQEAIWALGPLRVAVYTAWEWKNPGNLWKKMLALLHQMETPANHQFKATETGRGDTVPYILCQYQAGKKTPEQVIEESHAHLEKLPQATFSSTREKELIKKAVRMMVDPEILVRNTRPIKKGAALLAEVAEAKNADGSKKNRCLALSNWDTVSLTKLSRLHNHVFKHLEGLEISASIGHIKPNPEAYIFILNKYNLKPEDCVFIDDQLINIEAARKLGIDAIHLKDSDYAALRKELAKRAIV
jgi:FMN phosphatase YigB (HAD superfamily)